MLKCMIVGGSQAVPLSEFISAIAGGTIVVPREFIFDSFVNSYDEIKRSFIKVNYLVILLNDIGEPREEFSKLYDLLSKNSAYFRIGAIKLFGSEASDHALCAKYLVDLISELNEKQGTSIVVDQFFSDDLTYSKIYAELTDLADAEDSTIPVNKVYRAYRNDDSLVGYEPKPFPKSRIEREVPNHAKDYIAVQKAAVKAETGKPVSEEPESPLASVDLDIHTITTDNDYYKRNIVLICGAPKAGTSSLAFAIARSLFEVNNFKTNLFDISESCGSTWSIINNCKSYKVVDNKELLTGSEFLAHGLHVFAAAEYTQLIRIEYLKFLLSIPNRIPADYVVLDCDFQDLPKVLNLCANRLLRIILCSQHVEKDVLFLEPTLNDIRSRGEKVTLYLNDSIKYSDSAKIVDSEDVKEIFPWLKIMTPMNLSKLYNFIGVLKEES